MRSRFPGRRVLPYVALAGALSLVIPASMLSQGGPGGAPPPGQGGGPGGRGGGGRGGRGGRGGGGGAPANAEAGAPVDLTGYWVSVVTEDWRFRMVTPAKGDYASVPINQAGRALADMWDPAKDEAAGQQCKAYGAAGIMREPGRLHITWADPNTLKIDLDYGTQTRLLHFAPPAVPGGSALTAPQPVIAPRPPSLQGDSVAEWEIAGGGGRGRGFGRGGPAPAPRGGSLKVVTTNLTPGYLRKNGVPYGSRTEMTEYFDRTNETNGDTWLILSTTVEDPEYLTGPFYTSTNFKKEPDGSKWEPSACSAR